MGSPCTMPSSAWEEASGLQAWQAWGIGPHAGLCSFLRSNRLSASLTEPIVSRCANATRHKRDPRMGLPRPWQRCKNVARAFAMRWTK